MHDKLTHTSKGSAFVWYASRMDAERAILHFNSRPAAADPMGDQDRPLVVRRAKTRAKPVRAPGLGGLPGQVRAATCPTNARRCCNEPQVHGASARRSPRAARLRGCASRGPNAPQAMLGMGGMAGGAGMYRSAAPSDVLLGLSGLEAMQLQDQDLGVYAPPGQMLASHMQPGGVAVLGGLHHVNSQAYRAGPGAAGGRMVGGMVPGQGGDAFQYRAGMSVGSSRDPYGGAAAAPARAQHEVALSVAINATQLSAVNHTLYNIQAVSGAQLHMSPGAPGEQGVPLAGGHASGRCHAAADEGPMPPFARAQVSSTWLLRDLPTKWNQRGG